MSKQLGRHLGYPEHIDQHSVTEMMNYNMYVRSVIFWAKSKVFLATYFVSNQKRYQIFCNTKLDQAFIKPRRFSNRSDL